jgi:hypothetical protein
MFHYLYYGVQKRSFLDEYIFYSYFFSASNTSLIHISDSFFTVIFTLSIFGYFLSNRSTILETLLAVRLVNELPIFVIKYISS